MDGTTTVRYETVTVDNPAPVLPVVTDNAYPIESLSLDSIEIERGLQARVREDEAFIESLREVIQKKQKFHGRPMVVFRVKAKDHDGKQYERRLLADGHQRFKALIREEKKRWEFEVREGTYTDALRYALGANSDHGLPRTVADKERAIRLCLDSDDPKLSQAADLRIAKICMVSEGLVKRVRKEWEAENKDRASKVRISASGKKVPAKIKTKRGKTAEQKATREAAIKLAGTSNEESLQKLSRPTKGAVDGVGAEIPEQLTQVFASRVDVRAIVAILNNARTRVAALREAGALAWAPKSVEGNFDALIADLTAAEPYAVAGHSKHGFLSLGQYNNLSGPERKALSDAVKTNAETETATAA